MVGVASKNQKKRNSKKRKEIPCISNNGIPQIGPSPHRPSFTFASVALKE